MRDSEIGLTRHALEPFPGTQFLQPAHRNRKNEDWNEYDQMDAHELLRYLLDGVSMEETDVGGLMNGTIFERLIHSGRSSYAS